MKKITFIFVISLICALAMPVFAKGHHGKNMFKGLDLTQEQKDTFKELRKGNKEKRKETAKKIKKDIKELRKLIKDEKPDEKEIEKVLARLETSKAEMKQSREAFRKKISDILTPLQKAKMVVHFANRMEKKHKKRKKEKESKKDKNK